MMSNLLPAQIRQEIEFIRPIFEERMAKLEEYGEDWDDKPVCHYYSVMLLVSHYVAASQNDLLMWFMSETPKEERTVENLARRLLLINLAAIHSTSSVCDEIPSPSMAQS
jgi:hypothetical protein